MYIRNMTFHDEDTLLESLFDFDLGISSALVTGLLADIDKELETNKAYQEYRAALTDEEERAELETEERYIRLAEKLMELYENFEIKEQKLYAIKGTDRILLYEIDLF